MGNTDKKYRREKSIERIIENETFSKEEQEKTLKQRRKGINGYNR
jgi:hypothetical protein